MNYFAGGNTARGFYSLYESSLQGLSRLFILKGGPGTGKSSLMKKIGSKWNEEGYDIEYLHCSSDNNSIDGVIIPALKAGIVDGTAPHVIEPKAPGAIEEYVNLGTAWDSCKLQGERDEILALSAEISTSFEKAYSLFDEALKVHDEWEKIYIDNMDFSKADILTNELILRFFEDKGLNKKSDIRHRFLGAATPIGAVDFVPNLTEGVPKRYLIKGRPGSGKSTLLKKVAAQAEQRGFDVEVYHCGFDPQSLDMLILRELGIAIFDSTAPHEYFPERDNDEVIDMYEKLITPGTDEKYKQELYGISVRYKVKMKQATAALAGAKNLRDKLEAIYINAMDFSKVDAITADIDQQLQQLTTECE